MKQAGKYRLGFDIWGLVLFLIIMFPTFIWLKVPAPNDVLREESVAQMIELVASIAQVIMIASLCFLFYEDSSKPMKKLFSIGIAIMLVLYFAGWIVYYNGIVNLLVIIDLSILPILAFVLFSIARKNVIALLSAITFMICHAISSIINFVY